MKNEKIDIAIVGAGVSGLYSAWTLKQQSPEKKIVIFEGWDHVGGRLLSVRPPHIQDMVAELGGMRILENTQHLIVALIKKLNEKLPAGKKIETYPFPVDQPQNIAYLRGEYLRLADFTGAPGKLPYHLSFLEQGNSPGGIIVNAIEQLVPGVTNPKLTEQERQAMCRAAVFAGKPLYQQGFWNVLYRVISGEAYRYSMDAGGYDSTLCNWNAADAIPWYLSDFGITPEYKGFKNGFQQVPKTMAEFFTEMGGEIRLNSKLQAFHWSNGSFELQVNGETLTAGTLILAMPRRSLDLLMPACPLLQTIQSLIHSVTPRPLFKLFTTYANPWWRVAGFNGPDGAYVPLQAGRSVTDLPVRQTYYWPKSDGSPAESGESMLLASYDDGDNTGFWDGLRPQRSLAWRQSTPNAAIDQPFEGDKSRDEASFEWYQYKAPTAMVEEVERQLEQMHNLSHTPIVRNAAFRDWGQDPFGGGWNSWNIGVKSWEVKEQITHPINDIPLHICGEAYSDGQGWVEGALQSATIMLGKLARSTSKTARLETA